MHPNPAILTEPAEVTPEWMTEMLRDAGFDVRVRGLRRAAIGTGQMAHNERFELEFEAFPGDAPASLVIKFPSPNEESRASGARGAYRAEVNFYRELASDLAIRRPTCHYGALSEDASTFTLVLEDLSPAKQGDQIAGAPDHQIEAAVRNLAGLHAPRWGDPALLEIDWLTPAHESEIDQFMLPATEMFLERYAGRLSAQDADTLRAFGQGFVNWRKTQPGPATLVHGDYRLDNLLFASEAGGPEISAVDWQTLSVGSGARDLAYLLGNSVPPERRRGHEDQMLEAYRDAMSRLGVDLAWDDLKASYRHGSFHGPYITILGSLAVGQTDRGDTMFMAMAERSAAQIRDLDALELIA